MHRGSFQVVGSLVVGGLEGEEGWASFADVVAGGTALEAGLKVVGEAATVHKAWDRDY